MKAASRNSSFVVGFLLLLVATAHFRAGYSLQVLAAEVTLQGSMVCNGACISDQKDDDHVMVLFAIDGTSEVREKMDKIVKD
jgi:hypothetical protein